MVHLAFPRVGERHAWIEEGLATYVEPIARAQLAALTSEDVCGRFVEGMPNGVAVLIAGGNIQQTWSLERIFAEADQAMG